MSIRAAWPVRVHPGCAQGCGPADAGLSSSALRQCRRKLAASRPLRHAPAPVDCGALPRLARFARRMDPDGLVGVGRESTRVSLQARRVLVDQNPTPKRAGSELDAVRLKGVRAKRADRSRRAAAALISWRAQACGSAGDWGYGARPGPPPRALHQRTTIRNHKQTPNDHHRRAASIGPPKEPHRPTMPRPTVYGMGPSV
jgi:hypothetical protein